MIYKFHETFYYFYVMWHKLANEKMTASFVNVKSVAFHSNNSAFCSLSAERLSTVTILVHESDQIITLCCISGNEFTAIKWETLPPAPWNIQWDLQYIDVATLEL